MKFKTPEINKATRLYKALARKGVAEAVLRGRMLVVDPSCGSQSSQPGYAIRHEGIVTDSGVIDMPIEESLDRRLFYLGRSLRTEFTEKYDVVAIEDVPTHRFTKGRGGRTYANERSQLSLHAACHVIISSFDVDHFIRISPPTWWSFAPDDYKKSDESDALVMGHAIDAIARHVVEHRGTRKGARSK